MNKAEKRGKRPVDVEDVPEQEAAWREEIADHTVKLQERRKPLQNDQILRGVHPKSHGCVDADFIVNENIAGNYQVGLFAERGKRYKAKIRYSNAAVLVLKDLHDNKNGSRGMAIKVFDVDGPVLLEDGGARNQDFLMINTPEFVFGNVRDYRRLTRALAADENGADPKLFFLPLELAKLGPPTDNESAEVAETRQTLNNILQTSDVFEGFSEEDGKRTLHSFKIVQKIQQQTVRNPLQVQYFSAAPFRYGPDRVMKFSVAPLEGEVPQAVFSPQEIAALDPNYLAQALKTTLTQGKEIRLSFRVQVAKAVQLKDRRKEMIEDASIAWSEDEFTFREVAQIVIHPLGRDEQPVDACKSLFFTPWHGLAAHEPLGGINRLRKPVYSNSAYTRRNA